MFPITCGGYFGVSCLILEISAVEISAFSLIFLSKMGLNGAHSAKKYI